MSLRPVSVVAHQRRAPGRQIHRGFVDPGPALDVEAEFRAVLDAPVTLDGLVPPGQPWPVEVQQLARLIAAERVSDDIAEEARDRLAVLFGCGRGPQLRSALRIAFGLDPVEAAGIVEHRLRAAGATDEDIVDTTQALRALATT